MGRKYIRAGQYLYLCFAGLIFFTFFGCATLKEMSHSHSVQVHLQRSDAFLARGDYEKALRENQEVLSRVGKSTPGDRALFNMGLIYAHYDNPGKDYAKSREYFDTLVETYPRSPLIEQAKMWMVILDCVEKEKQESVELAQKVKSLEKQTKKWDSANREQNDQGHFRRGQALLIQGKYKEALKETDKIESKDKVLFNKGLIYAHHSYPKEDYKEAISSFKELIKAYPKSSLLEQAKIWVSMLDVMQVDIDIEEKKKELEAQVDTAIESKKKELEKEITQPETTPFDTNVAKTVPDQPTSASNEVKQEEKEVTEKREQRKAIRKLDGEDLSSLAKEYYGDTSATFCDLILKANPGITDVRAIDNNREITIPEIMPESFIAETEGGGYKVHIATFYTNQTARAVEKNVEDKMKMPSSVEEYRASFEEIWYRVMTDGSFKSKEEALQKVNSLVQEGFIAIPQWLP